MGERNEGVGKTEFYIVYMYEILSVNIKKKTTLHDFKSTDRVTMTHRLSWPVYKPRSTAALVLC